MSALGTEEGRETPYYHSKWEEEQAVKYSGLEHVIFRPSFVFGSDGGSSRSRSGWFATRR